MSWLLKIVEGPMAGAEVALVSGTRIKVGSTDECDIIVADASLSAFTLDVSDSAVTVAMSSGETRVLKPFEIATQGTTGFAVGPAEGTWQALTRPEPVVEQEPVVEPPPPPPAFEDEASSSAEVPSEEVRPSRRKGCGCVLACVALLVSLALVAMAWYFWPRIRERHPVLGEKIEAAVSVVRGWMSFPSKAQGVVEAPAQGPSLADIASQYGLQLLEEKGQPLLKGNVRLRTERLAIRALALKENTRTLFDLTDDETLKSSADELLFVVTEGALKVVAASNRTVVLTGYAPNAAEMERAVRALNSDVPGIDRLETSSVQVGGTPPPAVAQTKFAAPAVKKAVTETPAATVARRDYPIAGIITKPYPLVVMRNGLRLAEGAQVGTAFIERIEADRLILRDGKSTFEWKP